MELTSVYSKLNRSDSLYTVRSATQCMLRALYYGLLPCRVKLVLLSSCYFRHPGIWCCLVFRKAVRAFSWRGGEAVSHMVTRCLFFVLAATSLLYEKP